MHKHRWLILTFILFGVIFAEFSIFNGRQSFMQNKEEASPPSPSFHQQKNLNAHLQNTPLILTPGDRDPSSIISDEAYAISQLDEHPDQTEQKLKDVALSLEESELQQLKSKALDRKNNGDDRMLAVYLLSLSQHPHSVTLLEEIALADSEDSMESVELKQIIRAQAIEGLQNRENKEQAVKSLNSLAKQLKDSVLLERTQRALSHHLHGTPKVEDQDKKALEALVK